MSNNTQSLVLLNDGTIKAFGSNDQGQLGLGNVVNPISTPTLIPNLSNVKQISCGAQHSLVLLNDSTVKSFGNNYNGQLGLGNTTSPYNTPTLISGLSSIKQIACGGYHSLVLLNDGTVKACGQNTYGQLGLGNTNVGYTTPTLIPSLSNVKQISCGGSHSLALLNDGTVKSFGMNTNGQLGLGNITTPYTTPTLISSLSNVKQIACGGNHSLVLLNDGTVKSCGQNGYGQLGLGNTTTYLAPTLIPSLTNVNQIACGQSHCLVLLNDSTLMGFGDNQYGELGLGNKVTPQSTPILISSLTNIKQISCGMGHSLVLLNDSTVKSFGNNYNGQLGFTSSAPYTTLTLISSLSNISLLWDNIILRKRFIMYLADTKSTYACK